MKKSIFLFMTLFILSCSSPQKEEYNFATREVTEVENKIMLNELERYINIEMKYLFGGQDTPDTYLKKLDDGKEAGIDCSGLIVNLIRVIMGNNFKLNSNGKISYDVTANELYYFNSVAVPIEELKQGDLIFFDTNNSKESIEHVSIFDKFEENKIYLWDATTYENINKVSHRYYEYPSKHFNEIFVNYGRVIIAIE